jgi:Pectinacetylesterase
MRRSCPGEGIAVSAVRHSATVAGAEHRASVGGGKRREGRRARRSSRQVRSTLPFASSVASRFHGTMRVRMHTHTVVLTLAVAFVSVAAGCGSSAPPVVQRVCGPSSCSGCCTADGACVPGDTEMACGGGGAACSACTSGQNCSAQACRTSADNGNDPGTQPGQPIAAPSEVWTWVDFPDAVCGDGSTTGLALNPTSASNDIFIFMDGGGACWDSFTCFTVQGAPRVLTGYDGTDFDNSPNKGKFAVNRSELTNPFRNMSYVFIPYCTGDVHAGDAIQQYDSTHSAVHHKGAKNVEAFLRRLAPTFPNATRIFLTGSSGGAFGAQLNYERVATAFPSAEVHVFADSGQMINPIPTLLSTWLAAWNVTLPAGCVNCANDFAGYPKYLAETYPNRRFALTAYDQDNVLRAFFGYAFFGHTAAEFQAQTLALLANSYDPNPNAKYFVLSGPEHTMLDQLDSIVAPDNTTLNAFTTDFVNGAPSWSNVGPP